MGDLRALTIRQPHASLVAVGAKTIETRGFATSYLGPLLIHAGLAAGALRVEEARYGEWTMVGPPTTWPPMLIESNVPINVARTVDPLPLGAVVASCQLVDCVPIYRGLMPPVGFGDDKATCITNREGDGGNLVSLWTWSNEADDWSVRHLSERAFGDFTPGRYAWLLGDVKPTTERCPRCCGDERNWGEQRLRQEGGSHSCWWCNRTFTFNFMRDHGPHRCSCEPARRAACPACLTSGQCAPVPMRGRQGLWTPKAEDWATS